MEAAGSSPAEGTRCGNVKKRIKKGDYVYVLVPEHPKSTKNGYVLEHRIVVENHLGRMLEPSEMVHHRNHDKKDNRIENLELMTQSEHAKLHAPPKTMVTLTCPECQNLFTRVKYQTFKGQKQVFCSRSCNGRYQRRKQLNALVSPHASNVKKG